MSQFLPSSAELHYFLEIAHTGNLSRAAERLGVSQPALSLAMQRLEASFGVPLLLRGKTGVQLTHTGQRFLVQARVLLNEWDKIRTDALKDQSRISGRFVIGCHPSVAVYSLPAFLPKLLREHAALEFKLVHDLSRRITEDVISFKIDFGIVVNPVEHPDLVIQTLCMDEVTLWTGGPRSELQDVKSGRAVLICDPDLLQTQALAQQLKRKDWKFERTIASSNLEVITSLVARGAGVGVLPARVAGRIKSQGLKALPGDAPKLTDRICVIYRADAQKSQAGKVIVNAIRQAFAEGAE